MFRQPAVAALNHLLTQSGWALQRLARFSGKTAHFQCAPFSFACTIQNDGSLCSSALDVSADLSCRFPLSLLPRLALHDEAAFLLVESTGDAELRDEIILIARNLQWDVAEDLSRVTGDIAAERIVQFAKSKNQQLRSSVLNFSQALSEYWTEERPIIVRPRQLETFAQEVTQLRNEVQNLAHRLEALSPIHPVAEITSITPTAE
jgi:ubiquinone biosynthesis protein UbiJ